MRRIEVELLREKDEKIGYILGGWIKMGMVI